MNDGDCLPGLKPRSLARFIPRAEARGFCRRPAAQDPRRLEIKFSGFRRGKQVDDALLLASDPAVVLDGEEYMGRAGAIRDEDAALRGRFLCAADVFTEFSAGEGSCWEESAPIGLEPVAITMFLLRRTTSAASFQVCDTDLCLVAVSLD